MQGTLLLLLMLLLPLPSLLYDDDPQRLKKPARGRPVCLLGPDRFGLALFLRGNPHRPPRRPYCNGLSLHITASSLVQPTTNTQPPSPPSVSRSFAVTPPCVGFPRATMTCSCNPASRPAPHPNQLPTIRLGPFFALDVHRVVSQRPDVRPLTGNRWAV
ncbi:hypothetical protein BKA56DRAFT_5830 [Ilyonectria sp. MPI-CAGE-AT-0026]|nr:hypothetical protein BKA56DRAFT_5830 [Ilyonectria sp. MPI-CAGE-AT-0026]